MYSDVFILRAYARTLTIKPHAHAGTLTLFSIGVCMSSDPIHFLCAHWFKVNTSFKTFNYKVYMYLVAVGELYVCLCN